MRNVAIGQTLIMRTAGYKLGYVPFVQSKSGFLRSGFFGFPVIMELKI